MRVLLVGSLSTTLRNDFIQRGHEVSLSYHEELLTKIISNQPEIVCIDTNSVFAIEPFIVQIQKLYVDNTAGYQPILISVTPHEANTNRLDLIDLGFDLVFEEPIDRRLMFSSISALCRRLGIERTTLQSDHLLINIKTQDIYLKRTDGSLLSHVKVTPVQFALLTVLVQRPREIWSRSELTKRVMSEVKSTYSPMSPDERAVDKAIYKIRKNFAKKLKLLGTKQEWRILKRCKYPFIQTEENAGYYFFDAVRLPSDTDPLGWKKSGKCPICQNRRQKCVVCQGKVSLPQPAAESLLDTV
jgi:DNA-binding response OmpR family regulator